MIYLDNGATSFPKPPAVARAMVEAVQRCANPGRGGYGAAMAAAETVYRCRKRAGELFHCDMEQVVFTPSCTYGLNMAIHTLVKPGTPVVISGFEHNAVVRPLYDRGAKVTVAGRRLFDWADTLEAFEQALKGGAEVGVFTHVSNVFGYILPVSELVQLCHQYGAAVVIDAAQSAGTLPVDMGLLGADFIAMPGHKGLLGPAGTGLLLCGRLPEPLVQGGTGSLSESPQMPDFLPDRAEAGTVNVPGIAGLEAGMAHVQKLGLDTIHRAETRQVEVCRKGLEQLGCRVFSGNHQSGTLSFTCPLDCEEVARKLACRGIAVRAGLHCAPLAHRSAGTIQSGTLRVSFGVEASRQQSQVLLGAMGEILGN